jgi:hypothetical protein
MKYKNIKRGEIIKKGDQLYNKMSQKWEPYFSASHPYQLGITNQIFDPSELRRPIAESRKTMRKIKCRCPECGKVLTVRIEHDEQGAACPDCQRVFRAIDHEVK